jgi:hypothetical protein
MMYSAFGDESHDDTKKRVFSVGALFGDDEDWNTLVPLWIDRTGGKAFHATDCDSDQGAHAGDSHRSNKRLYADLTKIIAKSKLLGYAATVNLTDYSRIFPNPFDPNDPYYLCFSDVIFNLVEIGYLCVPQGKTKFAFDNNFDVDYNAAQLFYYMAKLPEYKFNEFLEEVRFISHNDPRIQAGDLLTREAMKDMDNEIGPVNRPRRLSMLALRDAKRFVFRRLERPFFEELRIKAEGLGKLPGATMTQYREWLEKYGYTDNTSNRIRYLSYMDALARGKQAGGVG